MTRAALYEVTWRGQDDYISDGGLAAIGRLVEKLPADGFDLKSSQAHPRSVTATLAFPGDAVDQLDHLEALLQSATVVRTLHANLVAARDALSAGMPE